MDFVKKYGDLLQKKAESGVLVDILVMDAGPPANRKGLAGYKNIRVKLTQASIAGRGVRVLIVDDTLYNFFDAGGKKEWVYQYRHSHSEHTLITQYEMLWEEGESLPGTA